MTRGSELVREERRQNVERKRDNCGVKRSYREIKSNRERAKNRETGIEKVTKDEERVRESTIVGRRDVKEVVQGEWWWRWQSEK